MTFAVIVTFNPEMELLKQQYQALKNQVDGIIYVDNKSETINIANLIESNDCIILNNEKNVGLAKAQNRGIRKAQEMSAEYVVLFDQDSIPPSNFVSSLTKCYFKYCCNGRVGLVGPAIRNLLTGSKYNEKGEIFTGLFKRRVEITDKTKVSYCIASGSFIPLSVIEDVGFMEEKLFIDGLDIEWCLRAISKGYEIIQTNQTYLAHCLGDGTDKRVESHSPIREYYIMRNSTWMIKRAYIPIGYRLRKVFTAFGRFCLSLKSFNMAYVKADIYGFYDGIKL